MSLVTDLNERSYFYALQPRWLSTDRLFMLFVTREALYGAYVAGQIHDDNSARAQLQQLYPLLRFWVNRILARRAERERHFLTIDPRSGEFLSADKRNFCIFSSQVVHVTVNCKRSLWAARNVGTVKIVLATGQVLRFILVRGQDPEAISRMLRSFCTDTTLIGEPQNAKESREAAAKPERWKFYAMCSVAFFGFGVALLVVPLRGGPKSLLVASILNLAFAVYCLIRAAKFHRSTTRLKLDTPDSIRQP